MLALVFCGLISAAPPEPLQIVKPLIDAGEVRVGPTLVRRFDFVNTGTEPLSMTDIKTSCGCISPALSRRHYQPGERGELTLVVNTLSQPTGSNRWSVQVSYRCDDRASTATLELTARLIREIEISPAALVFQGQGAMTAQVTIHDRRPTPLRVTASRLSTPFVQAQPVGASVKGDYLVQVEVGSNCPVGQHSETLIITTDDPQYSEIKVPVTIIREPTRRLTALPSRATLVAGGSAVVQLRSADSHPVQVTAIESTLTALTTRWAAGPGDFATVRIGLDRTKWHGESLTGEVRIRVRDEVIVIPVTVRADDLENDK